MKEYLLKSISGILLALAVYLLTLAFPGVSFASDPVGTWSTTTSLPYLLASQVAFSSNGKVFNVGGSAATGQSKFAVITATPDTSGNLSTWESNSTPMPTALILHSIATTDNYVYILGGREENPGTCICKVSTVYLGKIDSTTGEVSSWQTLTSLPKAFSAGAAAIVNNRIYFAGGDADSGTSKSVYWAPINSDGTIGTWTQTTDLPNPTSGLSMVAAGSHLIVVGGTASGSNTSQVYTATANSDGSIGSWTATSSLPEAMARTSVVKVGQYILTVGGANAAYNGSLDKIYYATVNQDGTLGSWQLSSQHLPQATCCSTATTLNNYVYLTGGFNIGSNTYTSNVYYSQIASSDLSVPLIKQTDPLWNTQVYDSATTWSPSDTTFGSWGCAVTSAVMVFKYYGITKLIDGSGLDPGSLNAWLKTQPDGYVGDGLVNWLALSRLSKLAAASGNNPSFSYDALEFRRQSGSDTTQLVADLNNGQPDILEEPGHFIVAKGITDTTFNINDPYYTRTTLQVNYNNTFLNAARFIPSHTNLSYIMLTVDVGMNLLLTNPSGQKIGNDGTTDFNQISGASYFTQSGIKNPNGSSTSPSKKFILIPTPTDGAYTATVATSSATPNTFALSVYEYDSNGSSVFTTFNGNTKSSEPAVYTFSYHQSPTGQTAPTDKTPPQIQSAKTLDTDLNGEIDTIEVEFIKDIDGTTVDANGIDFQIAGYTVTSVTKTGSGTVDIMVSEQPTNDTGQTPLITLLGDGLGTNNVGIKDATNGSWNHQQTITPTDGAAPPKPTASVIGGNYLTNQSVTLTSSDTPNTPTIYYTLDGSDPATSSAKITYAGAITINTDETLLAIAVDGVGNKSSTLSQTYGIAPAIDDSSITATASATSITVNWTTNRNAKSRVLFSTVSHPTLGTNANYSYENSTTEDTTMVTTHSVTVNNLTSATLYYYRVISRASPEQVSAEKSITLLGTPPAPSSNSSSNGSSGSSGGGSNSSSGASAPVCNSQKPSSAPILLSAFAGVNTVTLSWAAANDPVSYYLVAYGNKSGQLLYGNPNVGDKTTRSFVVQNLSGGQPYYFRVRAGNGCMPGDFSNEIAAIPLGFAESGPATGFEQGVLGATTKNETNQTEQLPQPSKSVKGTKTIIPTIQTPKVVLSNTGENVVKIGVLILFVGILIGVYLKRRK